MGLRTRVILILTIPALLILGAHGFLRVKQEEAQLLAEEQRHVDLTARAIQIAVEDALHDRRLVDLGRLLEDMVERQVAVDRIRLFDRDLRLRFHSSGLEIPDVPGSVLRRVSDTGQSETFVAGPATAPFIYHVAALRVGPREAAGVMEVVRVASGVERRVRAALSDVLLRLGLLLIALVVLTGVALQRQVLRPLERLAEGIRRLGHGEPRPLAMVRRDEIGRLARAFDDMAAGLHAARQRLLAETDRAVELEQHLRRASTLAVAGKLASSLAHEVGTPLNIISARAELLLRAPGLQPSARPDLAIIVDQIDRITRIINSLLDTVRPHKPQLQPTSMGDAIASLMPLLRHAARRRGVRIDTDVSADAPAALADPGQLQQILINLVLNAVEATPDGGCVTVGVRGERRAGEEGVVLTIADTGAGIPADVLPRIFEPFFTTRVPGEGTGLGLAICRDIVRAHGGAISGENAPDGGARFTVWVPAADGGGPA